MTGLPVVRLGKRTLRVPRAQLAALMGLPAPNGDPSHPLADAPVMLTVEESACHLRISRRVAYQLAREYLDAATPAHPAGVDPDTPEQSLRDVQSSS